MKLIEILFPPVNAMLIRESRLIYLFISAWLGRHCRDQLVRLRFISHEPQLTVLSVVVVVVGVVFVNIFFFFL
jgi:hypothetical protein